MARRHLELLVFVSGLSVMAVEMTGLRLLAPYFGTSLIVTTLLIGSMMAFLALGYSLGGKRGDRHPHFVGLCRVTTLAGFFVLLIPFAGQPILRAAASVMRPLIAGEQISEPVVAVGSVIGGILGILALFAVPVTLMGMVSPWAVRLSVDRVEEAGQAAGRLYALSTFGSIIGSFLPALVLVPRLGVRRTFIVVAAALLAVSVWGLLRRSLASATTAGALGLVVIPTGTIRPMDGLVYESESNYHFIQVVRESYGHCPDAWHLYLNEGIGVHSVKCTDPSIETRGFWNYMATAPLWRDDPAGTRSALMIGLAGGTIARHLLDAFPQTHIDGVEIDGEIVDVGKRWFDDADPRITPVVMDGRVYLQATSKSWDVVLIDAYRQPYIPFHLVTVEFFEEVAEHLDADGVLAVNVASVRGVDRSLTQMIYRTLRDVFPTVVLLDATTSNDVIFATRREKPTDFGADAFDRLPRGTSLDQARRVFRGKLSAEVDGWRDARVLTDDQAPVELAWDLMTLEYAK